MGVLKIHSVLMTLLSYPWPKSVMKFATHSEKGLFALKWVIGFPNTLYLAKFAFQTFSIWGSVNLKGFKPGMYIITLQLILCTKVEEEKKITNNPNFHQNTLDLNGNSTYLFYIILAPLPPSFVKWNWAFMKNQKLN